MLNKTVRGQTSITQHIICRGKTSWKVCKDCLLLRSHLSLRNLLCCTLYLPFLPLCHCTLPISSLITLSPSLLSLSQSVPSVQFSPTEPSQFLSPSLPLPSTPYLSFALFSALSLRICRRDTSVLKMGCSDPLLWYSKQSEDITHLMPLP